MKCHILVVFTLYHKTPFNNTDSEHLYARDKFYDKIFEKAGFPIHLTIMNLYYWSALAKGRAKVKEIHRSSGHFCRNRYLMTK